MMHVLKGSKVRRIIKQDFDRAFEKVDVILTVLPNTAFKLTDVKTRLNFISWRYLYTFC